MNLTYYGMIEMTSASYDLHSEIIGRTRGVINDCDVIQSTDTADALCVFFNENAVSKVCELLRADGFGDAQGLRGYIVGIPEDEDITEHFDADLSKFADVIEMFPTSNESRFNYLTGEFKRADSSLSVSINALQRRDTSESESEHQAQQMFQYDSTINNDAVDESTDCIDEFMPTAASIKSMLGVSLNIEPKNVLSRVIVTQAESNLAIIHALMNDDITRAIDKVDVNATNQRVKHAVKSSNEATEYLRCKSELESFMSAAQFNVNRIRARYQEQLDEYIRQAIAQLEQTYRSEVPDTTEHEVQEYLASIDEAWQTHDTNVRLAGDALSAVAIKEFLNFQSQSMPQIRRFNELKNQIRRSVEDSIRELESMNDCGMRTTPYDTHSDNQSFATTAPVAANSEVAPPNEIDQSSQYETQTFYDDLSSESHDANINVDEIATHNGITQNYSENERDAQDGLQVEHSAAEFSTDDIQTSDTAIVQAEEYEITDIGVVDLDSISDDADVLSEAEFDDAYDDDDDSDGDDSDDGKRIASRKLTSGLMKKFMFGVIAGIFAIAIGVGCVMAFGGKKPTPNVQTASQSSQAQIIGDTAFKVGDKLTITDQKGDSIIVTIKEFKADKSAIATDANGDKWLITAKQIEEYVKANPDKFEKSPTSSQNDASESSQNNSSASSHESTPTSEQSTSSMSK